jgi:hypothetical protein
MRRGFSALESESTARSTNTGVFQFILAKIQNRRAATELVNFERSGSGSQCTNPCEPIGNREHYVRDTGSRRATPYRLAPPSGRRIYLLVRF